MLNSGKKLSGLYLCFLILIYGFLHSENGVFPANSCLESKDKTQKHTPLGFKHLS